jgi:hypothetical protein
MHPIDKKLIELMQPVDQQIMMCDDKNDLLILCFGMMNRCKDVLDNTLGAEQRKELFREHC